MRAAVAGHPVEHSLSPVLHRAAYAALGLQGWTYDAVDVDAAGLGSWLASLDASWAGVSLTMPLKQAVLPLLASATPRAAALGVVNTVTFDGPGRDAIGDNTDVPGLVTALRRAGASDVRSACVLGGGATARSAVAALLELGCEEPTVCLRRPEAAGGLLDVAERLGARPWVVPWSEAPTAWRDAAVTVSTVPAGAADALAARVPGPDRAPSGLLLDVVYAPWPTRLAVVWGRTGAPVVSGFELLLHQAAEQVLLMTGRPAPVEVMRDTGLAALRERSTSSRQAP